MLARPSVLASEKEQKPSRECSSQRIVIAKSSQSFDHQPSWSPTSSNEATAKNRWNHNPTLNHQKTIPRKRNTKQIKQLDQ